MKIRRAILTDFERLVEMHGQMDREECRMGCIVWHPASSAFIRRRLRDEGNPFLVVEHGGNLVAFAYGARRGKGFLVLNLYVVPRWRRHGLARKLLTKLVTGQRVSWVRAFVLKRNRFEAVWGKLGFKVIRNLSNAFEVRTSLRALRRRLRSVV